VGASLMAGAILFRRWMRQRHDDGGARVYYAMSQDGLFFKAVGKLHPKYKTPIAGLMVQAVWTAVLCISGSYGQLLDYIIFAVLLFYILTIVGLFVLRVKKPNEPRPYKALGIRCCLLFTSRWQVGSVSYYCDTSPSTLGRA